MSRANDDPDGTLPLSLRKPVADDVQRELAAHLELRTEELILAGWSAEAARLEASRAFGDVRSITRECQNITSRARRSERRTARFESLLQDLIGGFRLLRRSPAFALTAIGTLALGIGANTAIFSVVNGLLLRPLPLFEPDRLVDITERHARGYGSLAWANFLDLREQSHSFDGMAEYGTGSTTVLGADEPVRAVATRVSEDFFRLMGVQPERGRLPVAAEHRVGARPVAVVSHRFWQVHMAETASLDGRHLREAFDFEVIGVLPAGFDFPGATDIWYPLELETQSTSRTSHNWSAIGRLRDGVTRTQSEREIDQLFGSIATTAGSDFDASGGRVTLLQDELTQPVQQPLYLLLGASALLLLLACTNLASSLLARGINRQSELATRTALGAWRLRLVRQMFTEGLVIAVLGAALGVVLAFVGVRLLVALAPDNLALLQGARLDGPVLIFAGVVAVVTAVIFGLIPALRISDVDAGAVMRDGARGMRAGRQHRLWSILVAVQVGLALVLLVGSGLLIRSFAAVLDVDLGFDTANILTVNIDLPEHEYADLTRVVDFHDRALERLRVLPGVLQAGLTNVLPLEGNFPNGGIEVEGKPAISPIYPITGHAVYRIASTGFFAAMGMKILSGRDFSETDRNPLLPMIVVNKAFADLEWPGGDAVGKRMRIAGMDSPDYQPWATIVGVVHDVPDAGMTSPAQPAYYYSYEELPYRSRFVTVVVRGSVDPIGLSASIREAYRSVDPSVPVEFETMSSRFSRSIADRRFTMLLLGLFATTALLLAAFGIYGVVAWTVAQRTREIGIRIALGAEPGRLRALVQRQAMIIVSAGVVGGCCVAMVSARVMASMLYQIEPLDPATLIIVALLLLATAWLASWLPARRGTRVDPAMAMRGG